MPPPPPAAESEAEARAARGAVAPGRVRSWAQALDRPEAALVGVVAGIVFSLVVLLVRLVPDVRGKPLFDDEVVAGLTALHPFGELVDIVITDRGGAPLHFVLAHVALVLDPSADALRWLSVVFALAAIPVCYDLGRRLGGRTAGVVAAIVAASSSMLAVYGTVGRMYALFAFVSALAVDLFVRALQRPTTGTVFAAALAAWLLPAVHPYGLVVVGIELAVALVLWRGRPLRPALPVLALLVALTPFVIADLRLSERFGVGATEEQSVAPADFAAKQLGEALAAFAGGAGALALVFFGLALAGLFVVFRRLPAFGVFALLVLAAVPVLMVLARAEEELVHQLSPRHLMFGLPVWAALVGVGVARLVRGLPALAVAGAVGAVAVAAVAAPAGISDPRTDESASRAALAGPADWVRTEADEGAVLLFYSPVYLASLPETAETTPIPRSGRPLEMVGRADYPVPSVVLTLPLAGATMDAAQLGDRLPAGSEVGVFPDWLTLEVPGPFADRHAVLEAGRDSLVAALQSSPERTLSFRSQVRGGLVTVCDALAELGDPCPETVLRRPSRPR
jgi:hypothetical protein